MKVLSSEQFSIFDSSLKNLSLRDQAIISLLLFCGLRNKELCQLNVGEVQTLNFVKNEIYVRASGNHSCTSRHVPVPANARATLQEYLDSERHKGFEHPDSLPLFLTLNQKIRVQPKDVYRIVEAATLEALGTAFSPHTLRHTYADRLLAYTNLRVVQLLLGHKSITSTQIYTHPTSAVCSAAVNKTFPAEKR